MFIIIKLDKDDISIQGRYEKHPTYDEISQVANTVFDKTFCKSSHEEMVNELQCWGIFKLHDINETSFRIMKNY